MLARQKPVPLHSQALLRKCQRSVSRPPLNAGFLLFGIHASKPKIQFQVLCFCLCSASASGAAAAAAAAAATAAAAADAAAAYLNRNESPQTKSPLVQGMVGIKMLALRPLGNLDRNESFRSR